MPTLFTYAASISLPLIHVNIIITIIVSLMPIIYAITFLMPLSPLMLLLYWFLRLLPSIFQSRPLSFHASIFSLSISMIQLHFITLIISALLRWYVIISFIISALTSFTAIDAWYLMTPLIRFIHIFFRRLFTPFDAIIIYFHAMPLWFSLSPLRLMLPDFLRLSSPPLLDSFSHYAFATMISRFFLTHCCIALSATTPHFLPPITPCRFMFHFFSFIMHFIRCHYIFAISLYAITPRWITRFRFLSTSCFRHYSLIAFRCCRSFSSL